MPVGQTMADMLQGLVAINRGDAQGAQAFTKQGRGQMAAQRQNQALDTGLLHSALQEAQTNPLANAHLQQFLQHGLANQQTVATTKQIGSQTTGQDTRNVGAQREAEFMQKYGGTLGTGEFGLRQELQGAQVPQIQAQTKLAGAETQHVGAQTTAQTYQTAQQQAMDALAQHVGFPTHSAMMDFVSMGQKAAELGQQAKAHHEATAAAMFGHPNAGFPDQQGYVTPTQRVLGKEAGMEFPVNPADEQRRKAVADAEAERQRKLQERGQKARGGLFSNLFGGAQAPQQGPLAPTQVAPPVEGPPQPPGMMQNAAESMLRKLGFDPQGGHLQQALDILRALTGGTVDISQGQGGQ